MSDVIERAARAVAEADYLVVTAGAGMGVDSGLPDFRGDEGFWKAYPPYARLGLSFVEMANPEAFTRDPALGWGFYGHRANLYRRTVPHEGFHILRRWASTKKGTFVVTSNVDGQFQKAGFESDGIYEIHGSIHWLQCFEPCGDHVWPLPDGDVAIDEASMHARAPYPSCPRCGGLARPNILMFGDYGWLDGRQREQSARWLDFLRSIDGAVVIVELGAGTAIPSIRSEGERHQRRAGVTLIRINPRESQGPRGTLSLATGALAGLTAIDAALPPR
ncbi:NAD-dependent deacetylase [Myxococcota bacterium]|nr:NAD-dependent deacetylase [Myxococcota bacterium]